MAEDLFTKQYPEFSDSLTGMELKIMRILFEKPVVEIRELYDSVNSTPWLADNCVRVHIKNIRRKMRLLKVKLSIETIRACNVRGVSKFKLLTK
jgi:DNA-binding response OmpR family regulator